ncbi:MAG: cytochrome c oxidase subunit II [Candidatus Promineifilaceae bacterium]
MLRKFGVVIGLAIMMSGCQSSPTFLNPASPISTREANLYQIILIMALVVFVLVEGALVLILVRDRKRSGDEQLPQQVYNNRRLEAIWTIIPIILVVILFLMTVNTTNGVAAPAAKDSDLNLRVVGHQWWWEFDYLDLKIATANELHIPVGRTVQINLESRDVIHSFWVPQLSHKTDVVPGQHNTMWLKGDEVGVYLGQCAEFCGIEHALMRFRVFVDSQEDFDAWVSNQQQPAYQPQTEQEQAGYKELTGACATCHSLDPAEIDTDNEGPNLAHLLTRTTFAGGTFDLNETNLRNWLHDTQAMKPGNDMEVNMSSQKIDEIMAYLLKLK